MTLGEQIVRLLENRNGQQEESTSLRDQIQKAINNSMANANPFEFGPHTEQQWKSRLTATERALGPYIELLLPELRERILESGGNGGAMGDERELIIDELHRFRHFLARKPVKDKLQAERQTLFARLYDEMNSQQHNFERLLSASNLPTGRFLTEIAAKIYALRAQRSQVDKLQKAGVAFFEDLPNYERFEQTLKELSEQLIAAEQEQFDAWCRDMIAHIVDGGVNDGDSISLQTTGRLMVLERARGILTVSFSDRLARLLREVSQLQSMGFKVPVKILACVQQGERFYEYGVLLKQVAHFYNTIEKQMLPCQQAMLLDEALAFEQLVVPSSKSGGDRKQKTAVNLTWESPEKLKGYIERLREAALQLTSHNRRLRKAHTEIIQNILELGETDLLRDEEKWNAIMLTIRQKFLEEQNFVAVKANMQPWANHLNKQLYKVLQQQFCWALADLQALHLSFKIIIRLNILLGPNACTSRSTYIS